MVVDIQTPLHDEAIERAVIGTCLHSPNSLATAIDYIGDKTVFYTQKAVCLWEAMRSVKADGREVDMLTVSQKIRALGYSATVPASEIMSMGNEATVMSVESEKNLISQVSILLEYYIKRCLNADGIDLLRKTSDDKSDALDVLRDIRIKIKDLEDSIGRAKIVDIAKDTQRVVDDIMAVALSGKRPSGLVMTGFRDLDEKYGGANNGDFIIVGARPAMGKTSFALCWARNIAKTGHIAGVISIEMPTEQLVTRLLSIEAGLHNDRLQKQAHLMTKQEIERLGIAGNKVATMPLRIVDDPSVNVSKMRGIVKSFKEMGAKIVFIDYLQIMRPEGKAQASSDTKFLDDLTRDLKQTAREFQIPIVALAQLSRSVEESADKRPSLNHLRMSGQIEANADVVMFLYRPEYYRLDMPHDLNVGADSYGKGIVIIAKNRNGGVGDVVLDFIKETTEFRDVGFRDISNKIPDTYYEPQSNYDDETPF